MISGKRAGFSLMEVLLATSILLGCIIVLAELASIGRRHAYSAEKLVNAQLLCEAKLNEILSGADTPTPVSEQKFEDKINWVYSIELIPSEIPGISSLIVEVSPSEDPGTVSHSDSDQDGQNKSCRLVRWIAQPTGNQDEFSSPNNGRESFFGKEE